MPRPWPAAAHDRCMYRCTREPPGAPQRLPACTCYSLSIKMSCMYIGKLTSRRYINKLKLINQKDIKLLVKTFGIFCQPASAAGPSAGSGC